MTQSAANPSPAAQFYAFPRVIDLSLDRMRAALSALGNPQDRIAPVIHVAGTNGKGSTLAFLRAMIEANGQQAHVYTSPHLVRIEERWRVAGSLIETEALARLADEITALSATIPVTIFEAETIAAFLAFARTAAAVTLLEVGLGGRLDATNVVNAPALTAITPVDFDHQDYLGDTIDKIASEKAGIIKPGVPVIVGPQRPEALAVIEARAEELGAPLLAFGRDWDAFPDRDGLVVQGEDWLLDLPSPALPGRHQITNAGAAVVLARRFGIPDAAIAKGVASARWPGRMQRLTSGPFAELAACTASEVWLDGGHNPHGAAAAKAHIDALARTRPARFGLVTAMLGTKDARGFFDVFAGA
ncbi:MAG: bifunctional folylpolyglutamate synthase/dihydrofolate synthase, partial [Hyphomonadaceae bacterium]|nr:bifunctional folylpolyglutamate synthase/dihydrofolate synthase [Hyphomonadaceae bacterium]